jgi:hypothetical protein
VGCDVGRSPSRYSGSFYRGYMEQLRDAIVTSFNEKVQSGALKQVIDKRVDDFITETVKSSLSSWGDFAKAFEKRVVEDLCARISSLSLEQYNDIVMREIQSRIDGVYVKAAKDHLQEHLDKMFSKPKEKYKLSEIVKQLVEDHEGNDPEIEKCSFHYDDDNGRIAFVYLDSADGKASYLCEYSLVFDCEEGLLTSAVKKDYKGKRQIRPDGRALHGLDALFFQIMAWGSKVELDFEEAEQSVYYSSARDY